jgi:hypothetical protein
MSGGTEYAERLREVEAERDRLAAEVAGWKKGVEDANRISQRERAERDRVADALAASEAARQRAEGVLREVEWEGAHLGRVCCPSCGGPPPLPPGCAREYTLKDDVIGHIDGCDLARALSADETKPEPAPQRSREET